MMASCDLNNSSEEESSENCDEIEIPQCATDAGHPRLTRGSKITGKPGERAYCSQCDVYFPSTKVELENHFKGHRTDKLPSCVYCGNPVFEYNTYSGGQTYHKCSYRPEESPSPAPATSSSSHVESDMNCNIINPDQEQ